MTDILRDEGYETSFVHGFNLEFAGTGYFLSSHSYLRQHGLLDLPKYETPEKVGPWGVYDDLIFDYAAQEIQMLRATGKPYYLTLTTNGGHFPDGVQSQSCLMSSQKLNSGYGIVDAIGCTNLLTEEFLNELQENGLLENTLVVIQSDHLIMKNALSNQLDQHERRNFIAMFGDDIMPQKTAKRGSMLDVFPTILEFAGFDLADGKAALGVSLLSNEPSLLTSIGEDDFNYALVADKKLSLALWSAHNTATDHLNKD